MTNRSFTIAIAVAILLSGASASFAAPAGAAAGGGASAGASSGAGGNGGPVTAYARVINVRHKTNVDRLDDARCGLGPMANGFYGPEIATFEQICANAL